MSTTESEDGCVGLPWPPMAGKPVPGYALHPAPCTLHRFPRHGQSGQFMCDRTGQIYLLTTRWHVIQHDLLPGEESPAATTASETPALAKNRGRPRRGSRQRGRTLTQVLQEIPTACDRGTKCTAQGDKNRWRGYQAPRHRRLWRTDCRHALQCFDARQSGGHTAVVDQRRARDQPLRSDDAAYCRSELREHSRSLGHVPLIDHNPRRGEKIEFSPAEAICGGSGCLDSHRGGIS